MAKKKNSGSQRGPTDESIIRDLFRHFTDLMKTISSGQCTMKDLDIDGEVRKRREQAVLALMPQIRSRYADDLLNGSVLTEDFAMLCSSPGYILSEIEPNYYVSTASAIWMLDALEQAGTLDEVIPYLPQKENIEYDPLPPSFHDAIHTTSLPARLACLIQHLDPADQHFYLNDVTARIQPVPADSEPDPNQEILSEREKFHFLLRKIPQDQKDHAVQYFQQKFWELLDLCFSILSSYHAELTATAKKLSAGAPASLARPESGASPRFAPLSGQEFLKAGQDPLRFPHEFSGQPERMPTGISEDAWRSSILEKLDGLEEKREYLGAMITYLLEKMDESEIRFFPLDQKAMNQLLSFDVEDPYEICFGYLCLVEDGSDLPWTYNPANAVLLSACRKLPWAVDVLESFAEGEETEDPEEDAGEGESKEKNPEGQEDKFRDLFPDPKDPDYREKLHDLELMFMDVPSQAEKNSRLYQEVYRADPIVGVEQEIFSGRRLNLPQILYAYTHCSLPRFFSIWSGCAKDLEKSGMSPEQAGETELLINLLLNLPVNYEPKAVESHSEVDELTETLDHAMEMIDLLEEDLDRTSEDLDRTREERDRLEEENRELKRALSLRQRGVL